MTVEPRSRFRFELADERDEAGLRELARRIPLPGKVEVTLRREPDFFAGASVEGPFHQVIVVRDRSRHERIVAMASRSVRDRFVDGRPLPVGYLGSLRLLPEVRGGRILVRGFRELRRLHEDVRAGFYLTTVTEENGAALDVLTHRRAGLPDYHFLGRYFTFVLPVSRNRRTGFQPVRNSGTGQVGNLSYDVAIRPLFQTELPQLVEFLQRTGRDRAFFPIYGTDDFDGPAATFRDLDTTQILTAWRGSKLVGTLALWDQSAFRQAVVERYSWPLNWLRSPYNFWNRWLGRPQFPLPGEPLPNITLALPLVADQNPETNQKTFGELLREARQLAAGGGQSCLTLGLFERDPLVPLARRLAVHSYVTRVYVVSWEPDVVRPQQFENHNLYLELGCL